MRANPGRPGRLAAILVALMLLSACGASTTTSPATTAAPTTSPATTAAPTASPAAVADEALVAALAAAWGNPHDAAKVAALYAPKAMVHELTDANLTSTGLEAIQARVKSLAAMDFKVVVTSSPIRQDDFVAVFSTYGTGSDLSGRGIVLYELQDGKVLNHWVYGAGTSPEASSPEASPPAADADEALVADLAAVMSTPYDEAKVAALYGPDAVIHETTANLTQRGLDAIGARIRELNAATFEAVVTSAPIRQGDFVANFATYGTGGDLSGRALVVYQVWDGKVVNQWIYPAE